jgi:hypothetical protein
MNDVNVEGRLTTSSSLGNVHATTNGNTVAAGVATAIDNSNTAAYPDSTPSSWSAAENQGGTNRNVTTVPILILPAIVASENQHGANRGAAAGNYTMLPVQALATNGAATIAAEVAEVLMDDEGGHMKRPYDHMIDTGSNDSDDSTLTI